MQRRKTIQDIFSSMEPLFYADFVAVKMNDTTYGSYYIYKNKHTKLRGFVSECEFIATLHLALSPIVLHEEYIEMSEIKAKYSLRENNEEAACAV